jgi:hypothetical protein
MAGWRCGWDDDQRRRRSARGPQQRPEMQLRRWPDVRPRRQLEVGAATAAGGLTAMDQGGR